jgi:hypothetical protein
VTRRRRPPARRAGGHASGPDLRSGTRCGEGLRFGGPKAAGRARRPAAARGTCGARWSLRRRSMNSSSRWAPRADAILGVVERAGARAVLVEERPEGQAASLRVLRRSATPTRSSSRSPTSRGSRRPPSCPPSMRAPRRVVMDGEADAERCSPRPARSSSGRRSPRTPRPRSTTRLVLDAAQDLGAADLALDDVGDSHRGRGERAGPSR